MKKERSLKPVAIWLLVGVGMIIVQILLGGITRLTGSGLSITEWKPLLGAIPPITEQEWQTAFSKYQDIAQYKRLNSHFTLADFKFIYFWEWLHRLWGRLIGVVFFIPFLVFLVQKRFRKDMVWPLVLLFFLGGIQGLIGWIMVKSGLNDQDLYVSHFRLAIHFLAALLVLVYTFWFGLKLLVPASQFVVNSPLKKFAGWIIAVLAIQLMYGAFMAGLKAGVFAPTWPDINGQLIPENMRQFRGKEYSLLGAAFNQPIAIHFIHRALAYVLVILILIWTIRASKIRTGKLFAILKWCPLVLVIMQVLLGIMAVLTSYKAILQGWGIFEWNAQLHQLVAMFLLLSLTMVYYFLRKPESSH